MRRTPYGQLAREPRRSRTSLIGREQDIAELCDLVLRGRERLVTLTGVGGCGKTRLAMEVAATLGDQLPDGVLVVELAPLSDPLIVPDALASALGIWNAPRDALLDELAAALQPRSLLLLLDNCEHVIDECARVADHLLSTCPGLRIIATSREPLKIAGERRRPVLPLAAPTMDAAASLEDVQRWPATQLFAERAAAVEPGFRLSPENAAAVGRICALLDGIPLAIELAAARLRVLSVRQILERLNDCPHLLAEYSRSAPARQQTLKATLDWSYGLLSAEEQSVFRRLAVFVGGCGLAAAEAACSGHELAPGGVLDVLARLVDKSLVLVEDRNGEAHYRLLEPVRQYGHGLLAQGGEHAEVHARMAAHYVALAELAEREVRGPRQAEWFRRLDRELDNIRAVLRRADEFGDAESTMRLLGGLRWYFYLRHLREGLRWIEVALKKEGAVPVRVRAKALNVVATMLALLRAGPKGLAYAREAYTLFREAGDAEGLALAAATLSHISLAGGDLASARTLAEEAVAAAQHSASPCQLADALIWLGQVLCKQGDSRAAVEAYKQASALFLEQGDKWGANFAIVNIATVDRGPADVVRASVLAGVRLYWQQGNYDALFASLENLARTGEAGRPERQVTLFAAAHTLRQTLASSTRATPPEYGEQFVTWARGLLGDARFDACWERGCALTFEQVVAYALEEAPSDSIPMSKISRSHISGPSTTLTIREREVARLLARRYSDRAIAEELCITERTASLHVYHILRKLGFRSRVLVTEVALDLL